MRKLTHRECCRLQGFPEEFKLTSSSSQTYKQMGNSVPVPVIRELFKEILVSLQLWDLGIRENQSSKHQKRIDPAPPQKKVAKQTKPQVKRKKNTANGFKRKGPLRVLSSKSQKAKILPSVGLGLLRSNEVVPPVYPKKNVIATEDLKKSIQDWHKKDRANHFMTPKWLTDFLRFVCPIELDAATSQVANSVHKFPRIFTQEINGLQQSWKVADGFGVFINPPYCGKPGLLGWANKIVEEYQRNRQPIFVLVPARSPESRWFKLFFKHATHIVFCEKRINHNELINDESGKFPSAVVVLGGDQLGDRVSLLSKLGECVETSTYRESKNKNIQAVSQLQSEDKQNLSAA